MSKRTPAADGSEDYFSAVATGYAEFRPKYPEALFDFLAKRAPRRQLAWDCGCGSGQATVDLAERFVSVRATDLSAAQIESAAAHPHVTYRVAPAHDSGLDAGTVDLVIAAQALHWFDLPAFYAEVKRVLAPGGVIAAWSYGIVEISEQIDPLMEEFRLRTVGPYWPAQRRHVENRYADLPFPFATESAPPFELQSRWNLPQLLGYLRSWSATGRYLEAQQIDPVLSFAAKIARVWGDPYEERTIHWPLTVLVGSVAS